MVSSEPNANVTKVPGILKAFVVTSGVILIIGVILLAVLIALRAGSDAGGETALPSAPVDLALPKDARIIQVMPEGKRLVLLAEDRDGQQYLAVVDSASGERLSLIRVVPAP